MQATPIQTAKDAYYYAREIIKGRWLDAELVIMFSKYFPDYAKLCGMNQFI